MASGDAIAGGGRFRGAGGAAAGAEMPDAIGMECLLVGDVEKTGFLLGDGCRSGEVTDMMRV